MSSTLLLLAEAALFLFSLLIFLRVRQVLQEIRHERVAWEGVSDLVDELSALMEVLSQVPLQFEDDLDEESQRLTGAQPANTGVWLRGNGFEQDEDVFAGWRELTAPVPAAVPADKESSASPSHTTKWSGILPQKYEMVLHLAEQGWNPLEIAQHTHLGREEVQLILNLWQRGQGN